MCHTQREASQLEFGPPLDPEILRYLGQLKCHFDLKTILNLCHEPHNWGQEFGPPPHLKYLIQAIKKVLLRNLHKFRDRLQPTTRPCTWPDQKIEIFRNCLLKNTFGDFERAAFSFCHMSQRLEAQVY